MSEYIEREAAIEALCCDCSATGDCRPGERCVEYMRIKAIPAADVRPVVRGRWGLDSDPGEPWRYVCNICGEKTKDTVMGKPRANFCPNCGCAMEGTE